MALRIVIVDDHPLTREALSSLLEAHGFDVVGLASDGAEAIVMGRLQPDRPARPSMPGIDGLAALPRLREALRSARSSSSPPPAPRPTCSGRSCRRRRYLQNRAARAHRRSSKRLHGEGALSGAVAAHEGEAQARSRRDRRGAVGRRWRVLLLLDDHLGTDGIAKRLYISEHTVRSHAKSMLRKLGVLET
jgi:DNA-binding NarL/FixJ family response regulator